MHQQIKKKTVINKKSELRDLVYTMIIQHGPNCSLNHIDVSGIKDFSGLFCNTDFNGDISQWDVSRARNMDSMFYNSRFNGDISKWNVSHVRSMEKMFCASKFNGDISKWNVSRVRNMSYMFSASIFNGDISGWNVSRVTCMSHMFYVSNFNQDVSAWNVSRVKNMEKMFYASAFNRDLSGWMVPLVLKREHFLSSNVCREFEPEWRRYPKKFEEELTDRFSCDIAADDCGSYEFKTADFEVEITGLNFSCDIRQDLLRYVKISWLAIGKDEAGDFELFQKAWNGQWFFDAGPYDESEDRPLCAAILRALKRGNLTDLIYRQLNMKNTFERIFQTMIIADDDFYDEDY